MFKYSIEAPSSESVLIRKCLLEGTRLDGRKLGDFREVKLTLNRVGAMQSVAEVQIAESRAICSVKGQIMAPFIDRPSEGVLNFSVETTQLSPLCKITDVELSRILERSIKDSDALDLEMMMMMVDASCSRHLCYSLVNKETHSACPIYCCHFYYYDCCYCYYYYCCYWLSYSRQPSAKVIVKRQP